jgi:hypothetical protein
MSDVQRGRSCSVDALALGEARLARPDVVGSADASLERSRWRDRPALWLFGMGRARGTVHGLLAVGSLPVAGAFHRCACRVDLRPAFPVQAAFCRCDGIGSNQLDTLFYLRISLVPPSVREKPRWPPEAWAKSTDLKLWKENRYVVANFHYFAGVLHLCRDSQ